MVCHIFCDFDTMWLLHLDTGWDVSHCSLTPADTDRGHEPADAPVLLQGSRVHSFVRRHFALRHIVLRLCCRSRFKACLEPQTSVGFSINLSSMFEGNPLMRNTPQKTWFRGPFWGMFSIGAMGFLIFGVVAEEHAECWT